MGGIDALYKPTPSRIGVGGRPTIMDKVTLKKLEEAFAIGASDKEACFYADISHQTLYNYQEKHPEFVERKEALKERPILLARQSVIKGMESDPQLALKYLERKRRAEFALRQEVTGKDGERIVPILGGSSDVHGNDEHTQALKAA